MFSGKNVQTVIGDSLVMREQANRSLHVVGTSPSDYFLFTIPLELTYPGRFRGCETDRSSILMASPDQEVDYVTSSTTDELTFVLPKRIVNDTLNRLHIAEELIADRCCSLQIADSLRTELVTLGLELLYNRQGDVERRYDTSSKSSVIENIVELCAEIVTEQLPKGGRVSISAAPYDTNAHRIVK